MLDAIESNYPQQRKRFEITLTKWLRLDGDKATWSVLELAITNAIREDLSLGKLSQCTYVRHKINVIAYTNAYTSAKVLH